MKKVVDNSIPKTNIKGDFVHADLNSPKGQGKILHLKPDCIVIGLNEVPYMLFTTDSFDQSNLPSALQNSIYGIKELILKPTFTLNTKRVYCSIPDWIIKFNELESLRFDFVRLDSIDVIKQLPIKHLILENIKYSDSEKIIITLRQLNNLQEVFCDDTFPISIIDTFKNSNLKFSKVSDWQAATR
jgi:hypothetical protein